MQLSKKFVVTIIKMADKWSVLCLSTEQVLKWGPAYYVHQ